VSPAKFDVFSNLPEAMVEETLAALPSRTDQTGEVLLKDKQVNNRNFLIEGGELDVWKGEPNTANGVKRVTLKAGNGFGERSAINGATANIGAAWRTDGPRAKLQRVDRLKALAGTVGVKIHCIQGHETEVDSLVDLDRTLQF
jgi:hypothetical protein